MYQIGTIGVGTVFALPTRVIFLPSSSLTSTLDSSSMIPSSVPLRVSVANTDAVVALFGQLDLHDADLRALRLTIGIDGVAMLEADFVLPGEFALATGSADRGSDYRITLRCTDVVDVALADFADQNVVAEFVCDAAEGDTSDGRAARLAITCSPGCDIELRCRTIAIVAVQAVDG